MTLSLWAQAHSWILPRALQLTAKNLSWKVIWSTVVTHGSTCSSTFCTWDWRLSLTVICSPDTFIHSELNAYPGWLVGSNQHWLPKACCTWLPNSGLDDCELESDDTWVSVFSLPVYSTSERHDWHQPSWFSLDCTLAMWPAHAHLAHTSVYLAVKREEGLCVPTRIWVGIFKKRRVPDILNA